MIRSDRAMQLSAKLVAKAVLPASARDAMGDTLGSFSALAIDARSWARRKKSFVVRLYALPDRGFNTPSKGEYSDYPGRIHEFTLTIPDKGDATLTYATSRYVRDADGAQTTGLDPGGSIKTHFDVAAPAVDRGQGAEVPKRLSLDAEGLARKTDGTFYISDEFSCTIYHVDAKGRMIGAIPPPPAIAPRKARRPHFTSSDDDPPRTGRQPNDGFEGLSLSPDGKTLFALMQSPLVQDLGKGGEGERFVRLVTYDVGAHACPKAPSGHYVVALPLYDADGKQKAPETNCIVSLPGGAFLVLARDGGGLGDRKGKDGKPRPIRFKRILQSRIDPAANLKGAEFDVGTRSVFRKGKIDPRIKPLGLDTAIDICDEESLNAVGLTIRPDKRGFQQISAKWEGMCLTPPLKPGGRERFLLVSNDNDFLTRDGTMPDRDYDAGLDNPNMILIYRVMIP
jgi:hypothetical protein